MLYSLTRDKCSTKEWEVSTQITKETIQALLAQYTKSAGQCDAASVANLYARSAKISVSGQLWASSRDKIQERLKAEYAAVDYVAPKVETLRIEIDKTGETAFVDESFTANDGSTGSVRMMLAIRNGALAILQEWILYTS